MLVLKIEKKEYKIEFTIEASLCNECTEAITGLMTKIAESQSKQDIMGYISNMANIPQTTLTMFYAGLLEHHGEDGDNSVNSVSDAKKLIKKYFTENPEENFYSLMEKLIGQMSDDGFFKQIGLAQVVEASQTKEVKKPQDHKKSEKATNK